ncbi:MAG: hypothetical protein JO033_02700 [Acidobacteriaceae bacterium]|nr:hypothetical protein [Acidobacteriaceae bacterium]MBV9499204.1 hypothetical protein [Acidobacteriaceae bacterium]
MATIKIHDRADQFRIEIAGRFAGDIVFEVQATWKAVLNEAHARKVTVDISRLSGYDNNGRKVLAELYRHGIHIAAATPSSLVFLNEISTPAPRRGPAVLHQLNHADLEPKTAHEKQPVLRAQAAGSGK